MSRFLTAVLIVAVVYVNYQLWLQPDTMDLSSRVVFSLATLYAVIGLALKGRSSWN